MTREQVKEILDRVLTWPAERQADVAHTVELMEEQDRSELELSDEQRAEVRRRRAKDCPNYVSLAEARRRLKMLGVSEELQQRYFTGGDPAIDLAPSTRPTPIAPASANQSVTAQPQPAAENSTDRQSTKVKALKLEDGDITTQ